MYDASEIGLDWKGELPSLRSASLAPCAYSTATGELRGPGNAGVRCSLNIDMANDELLYGRLWWATRTVNGKQTDVLVKHSTKHMKEEALMQWLATKALSAVGLGDHCPKVFDVFVRQSKPMFTMEPVYNAPILEEYLKGLPHWGTPHPENGLALLSVSLQVAMICFVLYQTIGFNHRDLKMDNVLVKVDAVKPHTLKWKDGRELYLKSSPTAILVDFGFACLGPGKYPWLQSGSEALSAFDFCPKVGRDVFMLLVFLLWDPSVQASLTPEHLAFLKSSLQLTQDRWHSMMQLHKHPACWIYALITEQGFQCPTLDSWAWIQACLTKFPELGSIKIQPGS
jgi:serine/threonine protein kinase